MRLEMTTPGKCCTKVLLPEWRKTGAKSSCEPVPCPQLLAVADPRLVPILFDEDILLHRE